MYNEYEEMVKTAYDEICGFEKEARPRWRDFYDPFEDALQGRKPAGGGKYNEKMQQFAENQPETYTKFMNMASNSHRKKGGGFNGYLVAPETISKRWRKAEDAADRIRLKGKSWIDLAAEGDQRRKRRDRQDRLDRIRELVISNDRRKREKEKSAEESAKKALDALHKAHFRTISRGEDSNVAELRDSLSEIISEKERKAAFRRSELEKLRGFVSSHNNTTGGAPRISHSPVDAGQSLVVRSTGGLGGRAQEAVGSKVQEAAKKGFHPTRKQLALAGGIAAGTAALSGAAYAGKKLYDRHKRKSEEQAEKAAAYYDEAQYVKEAAIDDYNEACAYEEAALTILDELGYLD